MNEIPPPLEPGLPKKPNNDEIHIPWKLADAARLQLEFLCRCDGLEDKYREALKNWLSGYNAYVAAWLTANYGPEAVTAADAISRDTANRMNANHQAAQERAERNLFEKLEEEFKNE